MSRVEGGFRELAARHVFAGGLLACLDLPEGAKPSLRLGGDKYDAAEREQDATKRSSLTKKFLLACGG
jgi:hypothetical protein